MAPCEAVEGFGPTGVSPGVLASCRGEPVVPRAQQAPREDHAARDQRTRELWAELHARPFSGYDPASEAAWFAGWLARVPCGECRRDGTRLATEHPLDFSSPDAYFASGVAFHNAVNRKLGKREWTSDEARTALRLTTIPG